MYFNQSDDDDDDAEDLGLLRKALDVQLPDDFDPMKVPRNGEEYIQLVMYETQKCQQTVIANVDETKVKAQTYKLHVKEKCLKAPKAMLPTLEWQQKQIVDFTKLSRFIRKNVKDCPSNDMIHESHWFEVLQTSTPTFADVTHLTEASKIKLLDLIISLLNKKSNDTISYELGMWIYSILATLDIPLYPNTVHCLRELARKCSVIRSKLPEGSEEAMYIPLNLIICIVARYFNQKDLADESDL